MGNNDWYITSGMLTKERIAYAALGISLTLTIFGIATSPNEVPIHWGFGTAPDAYGTPWMWLFIWILLTAIVALLVFMTRKLDVSKWNKPYKMDGKSLEAWYSFSMSIMFTTILSVASLELAFAAIFAAKLFAIMPIVVPALLAYIAAYVIYSIAKWRRIKRNL